MPLYDFKDTETGEIIPKLMKIAEREQFLKDNPNLIPVILSAPKLISGSNLQSKQDDGWKENLQRIAEAHPTSALADKVGGRTVKQAKVNEITKKHNTRVISEDTT